MKWTHKLIQSLFSVDDERRDARMYFIFKKWFAFFNILDPKQIGTTLKKLATVLLEEQIVIRIIDLDLNLFESTHLSFHIKEELFHLEYKLLLKMIRGNELKVKPTDDINFENELIVVAKDKFLKERVGVCYQLIKYYRKAICESCPEKCLLKERSLSLVNTAFSEIKRKYSHLFYSK